MKRSLVLAAVLVPCAGLLQLVAVPGQALSAVEPGPVEDRGRQTFEPTPVEDRGREVSERADRAGALGVFYKDGRA